MRLPGYAGQVQKKIGDTLNKPGVSEAVSILGGPTGTIGAMTAKGVPGINNLAEGLAEKAGFGQYKPGSVGINERAFTDMDPSNAQKYVLEDQRKAAQNRQFEGAGRTQLADASTMNAVNMTSAQIDPTQQAQMRAQQQDFISALQEQSAGRGPSLAGMQLDDARNQQIETAMALAASQRGLGAGQGLRSIAQQTQEAGQFAAREAARGRIAEQLAARQQLGGALQGARAQDIGLATSQAGLQQQASLANQAAAMEAGARNQAAQNQFALQQGSMDQQLALENQRAGLTAQSQQDALVQALNQQIGGIAQSQDQRLMDLERLKLDRDLELEALAAGGYAGRQQAIGGFLGGLSQAGASIYGRS